MFDKEFVYVCRAEGHEIKNPMEDTCRFFYSVDQHIDEQLEEINKLKQEVKSGDIITRDDP